MVNFSVINVPGSEGHFTHNGMMDYHTPYKNGKMSIQTYKDIMP